MKIYFFSFMRLFFKSPSCNRIPQFFFIAAVFFKKAAMIIAIHGQKHYIKVILSVMYHCSFEAIN